MTHQDIAETIGITRVTATRLINRLEQEGKIVRSHRNLILTTGEPSRYNE
ncbi:MAG: helix-turn-helix domain-containing protein [Coleofasciculus sp. C1-SOL-03]